MTDQNKRLLGIVIAAAILLIIPYVAMQFTGEVKWTLADFVIMGGLLFGTCFAFEFVLRVFTNTTHRIVICAAILLGFLLIWAELAVGIFGTPFAGS